MEYKVKRITVDDITISSHYDARDLSKTIYIDYK